MSRGGYNPITGQPLMVPGRRPFGRSEESKGLDPPSFSPPSAGRSRLNVTATPPPPGAYLEDDSSDFDVRRQFRSLDNRIPPADSMGSAASADDPFQSPSQRGRRNDPSTASIVKVDEVVPLSKSLQRTSAALRSPSPSTIPISVNVSDMVSLIYDLRSSLLHEVDARKAIEAQMGDLKSALMQSNDEGRQFQSKWLHLTSRVKELEVSHAVENKLTTLSEQTNNHLNKIDTTKFNHFLFEFRSQVETQLASMRDDMQKIRLDVRDQMKLGEDALNLRLIQWEQQQKTIQSNVETLERFQRDLHDLNTQYQLLQSSLDTQSKAIERSEAQMREWVKTYTAQQTEATEKSSSQRIADINKELSKLGSMVTDGLSEMSRTLETKVANESSQRDNQHGKLTQTLHYSSTSLSDSLKSSLVAVDKRFQEVTDAHAQSAHSLHNSLEAMQHSVFHSQSSINEILNIQKSLQQKEMIWEEKMNAMEEVVKMEIKMRRKDKEKDKDKDGQKDNQTVTAQQAAQSAQQLESLRADVYDKMNKAQKFQFDVELRMQQVSAQITAIDDKVGHVEKKMEIGLEGRLGMMENQFDGKLNNIVRVVDKHDERVKEMKEAYTNMQKEMKEGLAAVNKDVRDLQTNVTSSFSSLENEVKSSFALQNDYITQLNNESKAQLMEMADVSNTKIMENQSILESNIRVIQENFDLLKTNSVSPSSLNDFYANNIEGKFVDIAAQFQQFNGVVVEMEEVMRKMGQEVDGMGKKKAVKEEGNGDAEDEARRKEEKEKEREREREEREAAIKATFSRFVHGEFTPLKEEFDQVKTQMDFNKKQIQSLRETLNTVQTQMESAPVMSAASPMGSGAVPSDPLEFMDRIRSVEIKVDRQQRDMKEEMDEVKHQFELTKKTLQVIREQVVDIASQPIRSTSGSSSGSADDVDELRKQLDSAKKAINSLNEKVNEFIAQIPPMVTGTKDETSRRLAVLASLNSKDDVEDLKRSVQSLSEQLNTRGSSQPSSSAPSSSVNALEKNLKDVKDRLEKQTKKVDTMRDSMGDAVAKLMERIDETDREMERLREDVANRPFAAVSGSGGAANSFVPSSSSGGPSSDFMLHYETSTVMNEMVKSIEDMSLSESLQQHSKQVAQLISHLNNEIKVLDDRLLTAEATSMSSQQSISHMVTLMSSHSNDIKSLSDFIAVLNDNTSMHESIIRKHSDIIYNDLYHRHEKTRGELITLKKIIMEVARYAKDEMTELHRTADAIDVGHKQHTAQMEDMMEAMEEHRAHLKHLHGEVASVKNSPKANSHLQGFVAHQSKPQLPRQISLTVPSQSSAIPPPSPSGFSPLPSVPSSPVGDVAATQHHRVLANHAESLKNVVERVAALEDVHEQVAVSIQKLQTQLKDLSRGGASGGGGGGLSRTGTFNRPPPGSSRSPYGGSPYNSMDDSALESQRVHKKFNSQLSHHEDALLTVQTQVKRLEAQMDKLDEDFGTLHGDVKDVRDIHTSGGDIKKMRKELVDKLDKFDSDRAVEKKELTVLKEEFNNSKTWVVQQTKELTERQDRVESVCFTLQTDASNMGKSLTSLKSSYDNHLLDEEANRAEESKEMVKIGERIEIIFKNFTEEVAHINLKQKSIEDKVKDALSSSSSSDKMKDVETSLSFIRSTLSTNDKKAAEQGDLVHDLHERMDKFDTIYYMSNEDMKGIKSKMGLMEGKINEMDEDMKGLLEKDKKDVGGKETSAVVKEATDSVLNTIHNDLDEYYDKVEAGIKTKFRLFQLDQEGFQEEVKKKVQKLEDKLGILIVEGNVGGSGGASRTRAPGTSQGTPTLTSTPAQITINRES